MNAGRELKYRTKKKVDFEAVLENLKEKKTEKNHQYYTIYCIPTFGPPCMAEPDRPHTLHYGACGWHVG